jgi:hypothetical protein
MAVLRVEGFMTQLEENGYALLSNVLPATKVDGLLNAIEDMRTRQNTTCAPGVRQLLKHCDAVRALSTEPPLFTPISEVLGYAARPVRAILFDKSPASNWYVTWHQDLSIPVRQQLVEAQPCPSSIDAHLGDKKLHTPKAQLSQRAWQLYRGRLWTA